MLVSGGIGYVLGARAGRERYEQIRSTALKIKGNPTVQATASKAADAAKEAAPVVKEKVTGTSTATSPGTGTATGTSPGTATGSNGVPLGDSAYPKP